MSKPRFITFEGIDGAGKTTQARRLAQALRQQGGEVVHTREPGGAPGAEKIRNLVLRGAPECWSPQTEILLFMAARRDHLERTIRPALAAGKTVVCDRFSDSSRIYQTGGRKALRRIVDRLHDLVIGLEPDLTILLDIDPQHSFPRARAGNAAEQRFEDFGYEFQRRMRQGYLELAAQYAHRFCVIDANRLEDTIAQDVLTAAQQGAKQGALL
ncbi:MAG: dTMP kinase [Rhodobacteraceae bacterium]|nr:dTMP kinase [Paracoccaceae bacterium]